MTKVCCDYACTGKNVEVAEFVAGLYLNKAVENSKRHQMAYIMLLFIISPA